MKNESNLTRRFPKPAALIGAIVLLLAACSSPTPPPVQPTPAASTTTPADGVDRNRLSPELSIYIWSEYLAPEVVEKFEQAYGVRVVIDTYEDNESLFAKLQAGGNPGYDLIVPSDYMVERMIKAGMLEKIDWANVPNIRNIGEDYLNLYFDPDQQYSVPYFWGTTGIAYDAERVSSEITSWRDIFEPRDEIKGRIGLLNDQRETIGAALRYLGYSANSANPAEIEAAKELLLRHKQYVAGYYDSIVARDNLISGDVVVAMTYPGDAMVAAQQKSSIKYLIPQDGATIWQDAWCIPVGAPHKYTAEVFLNFILRPDIAALNANALGYPTTNSEAVRLGLIDPALAQNPTIYPDLKSWGNRLEFLKHFEGNVQALYDRAWTEVGIGQ
ncbi:MAG: spermidine/putrescine ABC transporter substrate-binding protein [Anaerolineae bacterium]|nr:spermidine/putrescine ABC transporter substrate-binding protein [Thermoflexales bacterium]MDW8408432.1 spermidine/putrescine ABC transporter substrate-binding protein [Anaerolineae bacterium]